MKHTFAGDRLKRKKTFLFHSMLIYFLLFNQQRLCPIREFIFCNKLDRTGRQNSGTKVA